MKKYGLLGQSLDHSFSQTYFEEKFLKENISAQYHNYILSSIDEVEALFNFDVTGFNVTIPYKETIIPFLDYLEPVSKQIGAVNTIKFYKGKSIGYNTDVVGFETSIKEILKNKEIVSKNALILGTGGASKAIEFVLDKLGFSCNFVSRSGGDILYKELNKNSIDRCSVIVNTTPLGTYPEVDLFPEIPYRYLEQKHLVYDLVYNPRKSVFLAKAEERGATICNGLKMLEFQAEASWKIWNKKKVDLNIYHKQ